MKWYCQTSSTSTITKVVHLIVFKIVLQVSICSLTRWCAFSTTTSDPQPSWPVHIVHKADQAVTRDRYAAGDTTLSAINSSTPVPGLQSGSIVYLAKLSISQEKVSLWPKSWSDLRFITILLHIVQIKVSIVQICSSSFMCLFISNTPADA